MTNMNEIGIEVNIVKVPWMSVVEEMSNIDTSPNIVTIFVSPHYAEAGSLLESRYHSNSSASNSSFILFSNFLRSRSYLFSKKARSLISAYC